MDKTHLRRAAAVSAAVVLGGGAGAGIYAAATSGPSSTKTDAAPAPSTTQPVVARTSTTSLEQLYKNVTPGVVDITVTDNNAGSGIPGFPGGGQSQAEGTGFVYDTAGHIVTNAHVVDGASSITVHFKDGSTAKATLVGADDSSDVAVIKVNVDASKLHPLTLGTSSTVQPGEAVVAIGSPFGLTETMTAGIVSAVGRTITAPNNYSIAGAIQTDAAINHGNSGGPLLDTNGNVIGVNAQIQTDQNSTASDNAGVGFALPIDSVKKVADTFISGGKVQHAYLGISVGDTADNTGAQIERVVSGSPADKAGLQAGDVITAIDGATITNSDELTAAVGAKAPGDKVTITIKRNGATKTIDVTLGVRPS